MQNKICYDYLKIRNKTVYLLKGEKPIVIFKRVAAAVLSGVIAAQFTCPCFAETGSANSDAEFELINNEKLVNEDKNALPGTYIISDNATYNDIAKAAGYIQESYSDLLGMKAPVADISSEGYDIGGNMLWRLSFYEGEGNYESSILNYNFKRVRIYGDEEGNLSQITIIYSDMSDEVGHYPLISEEKAEELLAK